MLYLPHYSCVLSAVLLLLACRSPYASGNEESIKDSITTSSTAYPQHTTHVHVVSSPEDSCVDDPNFTFILDGGESGTGTTANCAYFAQNPDEIVNYCNRPHVKYACPATCLEEKGLPCLCPEDDPVYTFHLLFNNREVNCEWITRNDDPVAISKRRSKYCYDSSTEVGENCAESCGFCKGTFWAPSNHPSVSPITSLHPSECIDEPNWRTSGENGLSCLQIEQLVNVESINTPVAGYDYCEKLSSIVWEGKSIKEACCVCGGSVFQNIAPSTSPSVSAPPSRHPSNSPTECIDEPGWEIHAGVTCADVELHNTFLTGYSWCDVFGQAYWNGKSVHEACCTCGGNAVASSPSATPTKTPKTLFPTKLPTKTPKTAFPTKTPTKTPKTAFPTKTPTKTPKTAFPTKTPTKTPKTLSPTKLPTKPPKTAAPTTTATSREKLFSITLINTGINTEFDVAFNNAKARWESIIIGDLQDYPSAGLDWDWFYGQLSSGYYGAVDDIVIGYEMVSMDGYQGVLGAASPIYTRGNTGSPISGYMRFDKDDFAIMGQTNAELIILHEMGHVLGLVGVLGDCRSDCSFGYNYPCPLAQQEYESIFPGSILKLENDGNVGTSCFHWDEESFPQGSGSSELMTGWFEENVRQPISRVTIAALDESFTDYVVDYSQADPILFDNPSHLDSNTKKSNILSPTETFSLMGRIEHSFTPIML